MINIAEATWEGETGRIWSPVDTWMAPLDGVWFNSIALRAKESWSIQDFLV